MKRFNINLPDEVYEQLRSKAFAQRRSMSEVVIIALMEKPLIDLQKNSPVVSETPGTTTGRDLLNKQRGELNGDDYI